MKLHSIRTMAMGASIGIGSLASATYLKAAELTGRGAEQLEEIVVTAEKRTQNQRDVPSSITVVSGSELRDLAATQLTDYATYVPGLAITNLGTPGQTQIILRGINTGTLSSATVGTYVDDVPYGSSTNNARGGQLSLDLSPYDVQQIEVLRGPQGTLYGASTLGGLLKYDTSAPSLNTLDADVGADYTYAQHGGPGYNVRAAIDAPIIANQLAIRISAFRNDLPGWIDNVATGTTDANKSREDGARTVILWKPIDDLSVRLTAHEPTYRCSKFCRHPNIDAGPRAGVW